MADNQNYKLNYSHCSVFDFIRDRALSYKNTVAIDYYGRKITYSKLINIIEKTAEKLYLSGVRKGDHVAVILPNIPEAVYLFYACSAIGAIADMIHPLSAVNELKYYVKLTNPKLIFAIDMLSGKLQDFDIGDIVYRVSPSDSMSLITKVGYKFVDKKKNGGSSSTGRTMSDFMKQSGKASTEFISDGSLTAAVLYSGGTTGKSKAVMLSGDSFNAIALQAIESCGCLNIGDRMLTVLPVFHGFGLGVCVHTVFSFGGTSVMRPQFRMKEFMKLLEQTKPQVLAGVPAIFETIVRNDDPKVDLTCLKCVISGGDALSVNTQREMNALLKRHGCNTIIRQGYGLTECLSGTCLMPADSDKEGSIGLPYSDNLYKIVKPGTDEEMPVGARGEIVISGLTIMQGYFNEPDETNDALKVHSDGLTWLHTGDEGYIDEDGFVFFTSRIKRLIISNGYNIYPQQLESVIMSHPAVDKCVAVGIPHELRGEIARACIVLKPGFDGSAVLKEIKLLCEDNLSKFSLPREYKFVDSIPLTDIGKTDYRKLIELK